MSDSATPWTAAHQASLSFTIPQSLLTLMSIESMMPSNHLILCHPLLLLPSIFPSIRIFSFLMSRLFASGGQSIGTSASASVLPMKIQGWFHLGLTGLTLQSERVSRVFSNTTVLKHHFFGAQPSLWSNSHILTPGSNPQMVYTSGFGVLNFLQYLNPTRHFKVCFVFSLFYILDQKILAYWTKVKIL